MATNGSTGSDGSPSVTQLVSGIVGDVQDLGMQHLALFRREIQDDLRKSADAVTSLGIGLAVAEIGGIALALMLVHLLSQFAPNLPLWGCYGIVGVVIAGLGVIAIFRGIQKLQSVNSLSHPAARVMEEDVEWLTNSK